MAFTTISGRSSRTSSTLSQKRHNINEEKKEHRVISCPLLICLGSSPKMPAAIYVQTATKGRATPAYAPSRERERELKGEVKHNAPLSKDSSRFDCSKRKFSAKATTRSPRFWGGPGPDCYRCVKATYEFPAGDRGVARLFFTFYRGARSRTADTWSIHRR
ncbi:hypothetical protein HDV57DRAFT_220669 [Trichoderma longibrachiatum]|uniref:Uncharacterized protein n=1 Tax=Trichoderma longibrachiatum ATCC 18648 TaxID=983965 RepID=A0A2T4C7M4_TRILO|nr:hypothetical protein M440DRAFT_1215775 [Trichoderma longibrachiatum ATCC 18648]